MRRKAAISACTLALSVNREISCLVRLSVCRAVRVGKTAQEAKPMKKTSRRSPRPFHIAEASVWCCLLSEGGVTPAGRPTGGGNP